MTREVWRHPDRPGGLDPLLDARFEELTATGSLPIVDLGPRPVTRPTERSRTVTVARIRKALVAGAGALSASLATGAADGALDRTDWLLAAGAALVVGWATWQTRNAPEAPVPPAGPEVDEH